MTLDKNKTVAEIGRRTRLRNHDVQRMFEALIEVWTEELTAGGRIEIAQFLVLAVESADHPVGRPALLPGGKLRRAPGNARRVVVRASKYLRRKLTHKRE